MPNYCINTLSVYGKIEDLRSFFLENNGIHEDDNGINIFIEKYDMEYKDTEEFFMNIKDDDCYNDKLLSFNRSVNLNGWDYNRAVELWGTKWDAFEINIDFDFTSDPNIMYSFDTAWSPPSKWIKQIGEKYKNLKFVLIGDEAGVDFHIEYHYENGLLIKEVFMSFEDHVIEKFEIKKEFYTFIMELSRYENKFFFDFFNYLFAFKSFDCSHHFDDFTTLDSHPKFNNKPVLYDTECPEEYKDYYTIRISRNTDIIYIENIYLPQYVLDFLPEFDASEANYHFGEMVDNFFKKHLPRLKRFFTKLISPLGKFKIQKYKHSKVLKNILGQLIHMVNYSPPLKENNNDQNEFILNNIGLEYNRFLPVFKNGGLFYQSLNHFVQNN